MHTELHAERSRATRRKGLVALAVAAVLALVVPTNAHAQSTAVARASAANPTTGCVKTSWALSPTIARGTCNLDTTQTVTAHIQQAKSGTGWNTYEVQGEQLAQLTTNLGLTDIGTGKAAFLDNVSTGGRNLDTTFTLHFDAMGSGFMTIATPDGSCLAMHGSVTSFDGCSLGDNTQRWYLGERADVTATAGGQDVYEIRSVASPNQCIYSSGNATRVLVGTCETHGGGEWWEFYYGSAGGCPYTGMDCGATFRNRVVAALVSLRCAESQRPITDDSPLTSACTALSTPVVALSWVRTNGDPAKYTRYVGVGPIIEYDGGGKPATQQFTFDKTQTKGGVSSNAYERTETLGIQFGDENIASTTYELSVSWGIVKSTDWESAFTVSAWPEVTLATGQWAWVLDAQPTVDMAGTTTLTDLLTHRTFTDTNSMQAAVQTNGSASQAFVICTNASTLASCKANPAPKPS